METTHEHLEKMHAEPQQEHKWLKRLVGEWNVESEMAMDADQPPERSTGTETVRSLEDLWFLCEGRGEMPGGGDAQWLMTLGYDVRKKAFVGTWIGSMMTNMFVYEGELGPGDRALTLETEGPDMTGEGTARYRDVMEFDGDDHRVLTSHIRGEDGEWRQIVEVHYRRKA